MNAPVTRRALLGATAAVGTVGLPSLAEPRSLTASNDHPDADLFRSLDAWGPARAAADDAEERAQALWDVFVEQEPEWPKALHVRFGDDFGVQTGVERKGDGPWIELYDRTASEQLRRKASPTRDEWKGQPAPWNAEEQVGNWVPVPDERRIARRAEILAAHDAWWAECQVVKERLGIPTTDEAEEEAYEALCKLERAILATAPLTMSGLTAKARWAACSGLPDHTAQIWAKQITADVIAMAERGGAAS